MKFRKSSQVKLACLILVVMVLVLGQVNAAPTKNVILMIGDGMGTGAVSAGRYYLHGATGQLCFEPHYKCSVATHCLDSTAHPVTDSAAAGSALATGHKVNYLTLSQSPSGVPYTTILEHAKAMGKRTGLIGTDPITRATPAAFGAHEVHRDNYDAIAGDFLTSSLPDVLMGGGGTSTGTTFFSNARITQAQGLGYQNVSTKTQMDALSNSTSRVLGLYTLEDMAYEYDRRQNPNSTEPQLSEMTAKTLALLDTDPDGFFLMVEGAKIDYAGHQLPSGTPANAVINGKYLTWEVVAFNQAVQTVLTWMQGRTDTLLIVTADHETGGVTAYNNGAGQYPTVTFSTNQHTGVNVPLYAVGSNAHLFDDYISGGAMDNTNVYTVMSRAFSGEPYRSAPFKIYEEVRRIRAGNNYYSGGVYGGEAWFGQIGGGANTWGVEQKWGPKAINGVLPPSFEYGWTACTHSTDFLGGDYLNLAKSAFPLGGYIYMVRGAGDLCRVPSWDSTAVPEVLQFVAADGNMKTSDSAVTDGTYIYMGTGNDVKKIFKIAVSGSTLSEVWMASMPNRVRSISPYYNDGGVGKLYAADSTNGKIYEILASNGTYTEIAQAADTASVLYQCARYGNEIFAVDNGVINVGVDRLHTFTLNYGTWSETSVDSLGDSDFYSMAVIGDGAKAQYFWTTCLGTKTSFWALRPFESVTDLSDPMNCKNGYPVYTQAIVTVLGPAGQGFWIENEKRTTGAWVPWTGTTPDTGDLVTIKGQISFSVAGEKTLTPIDNAAVINNGAGTHVKPLLLTNKSILPATDGNGLGNAGLLVTVYGKLSGVALDPIRMYVDDGSGVPTGLVSPDPEKGVKVVMADGQSLDIDETLFNTLGDFINSGTTYYVKVTGIVSPEIVGGNVVRQIKARSFSDIVFTTP